MGIIQENRLNAPQPEVKDTDYGARYVKAATETPISEIPPAKEGETKVEPVPLAKDGDVTTVELNANAADLQEDADLVREKAQETDLVVNRIDANSAISVGELEITTVTTQKEEKPKKKAGRPKKNRK